MNLLYSLKACWLSLLVALGSQAYGQVEIRLQDPQRDYAIGESITFEVISRQRGELRYLIRESLRTWPVLEQRIAFTSDTMRITYAHPEAAFLTFEAIINGQYQVAGLTVARDSIMPSVPEPVDFDAFWQNQKNLLADVPMDIRERFVSESPYSRTYEFDLAQIDGRRVYGYLVMPKGSGPFPASLRLPPFGRGPNSARPDNEAAERANCIALSISIHNTPVNQEDRNAYEPNDLRNPETIYYRYAILAAVRALDYLETKAEWNGEDLMVYGDSQGGGLAMLLAGIDERPNLLVQSVAALSQHSGILNDDPSGFPYYIETARALYAGEPQTLPQVYSAVGYYDAVYAARRFRGASMHFSNYLDDICPPSTVYAAFNAMQGPKINLHTLNRYHSNVPEFINDLHDFTRLYFDAALRPPFPFGSSRRGYLIDAGPRRNTRTDSAITLGALARFDGQNAPSDWQVEWTQISGPAMAQFQDPSSVNAPVVFPDSGRYRLQIKVTDPLPEDPMKFWVLIDEIEVFAAPGQRDSTIIDPDEPTFNPGSSSNRELPLLDIRLWPNPASDEIQLNARVVAPGTYRISLRDALGRELQYKVEDASGELNHRFDTSDLGNGVYLVQIASPEGSFAQWVNIQH